MFAPGVEGALAEFHSTSGTLGSFVVSVYVIGYAVGPLIVAPLSEMYGRVPLYHASNILFIIFTVACAVTSSLPMLIVFRLFAGAGGTGHYRYDALSRERNSRQRRQTGSGSHVRRFGFYLCRGNSDRGALLPASREPGYADAPGGALQDEGSAAISKLSGIA